MARILVVDDEPLVRRAVSRLMQRLGHVVAEAADADSALRLTRDTMFDVAFVDYDMPGGPDGLAVLARLREIMPRCVRVLMTGRTDFPVVVEAINKGQVLRVLPKPFHAEQLEELLDEVVEAARRLAALAADERDVGGAVQLVDQLIAGEHLSLVVQPIVDGQDPGAVRAVECLMRSSHPVLSGPDRVLTTTERASRVHEVGGAVNRLAARWAARIPEDILLFVNVHPVQLEAREVARRFAPLVPHAHRVVLEITERASVLDMAGWEGAIRSLEELGFQIGSAHV